MTPRQLAALKQFTAVVKELRDSGVIRSHRYLGDIAEFVCMRTHNVVLEENLRAPGHDGIRGNKRVQVKYGGGTKTNVSLGNPDTYEEILVVLGPDSVLRDKAETADLLIYTLTAEDVRACTPGKQGSFSCGKKGWQGKVPERISLEALVKSAEEVGEALTVAPGKAPVGVPAAKTKAR